MLPFDKIIQFRHSFFNNLRAIDVWIFLDILGYILLMFGDIFFSTSFNCYFLQTGPRTTYYAHLRLRLLLANSFGQHFLALFISWSQLFFKFMFSNFNGSMNYDNWISKINWFHQFYFLPSSSLYFSCPSFSFFSFPSKFSWCNLSAVYLIRTVYS